MCAEAEADSDYSVKPVSLLFPWYLFVPALFGIVIALVQVFAFRICVLSTLSFFFALP